MKKKWSIPTTYNGIKYRSKLEARLAEFFDKQGIKHIYEPEGFNFDGIWYLPDFYLPDVKVILEAKGILDELDKKKLFALEKQAKKRNISVVIAEYPVGKTFKLVESSGILKLILGIKRETGAIYPKSGCPMKTSCESASGNSLCSGFYGWVHLGNNLYLVDCRY